MRLIFNHYCIVPSVSLVKKETISLVGRTRRHDRGADHIFPESDHLNSRRLSRARTTGVQCVAATSLRNLEIAAGITKRRMTSTVGCAHGTTIRQRIPPTGISTGHHCRGRIAVDRTRARRAEQLLRPTEAVASRGSFIAVG